MVVIALGNTSKASRKIRLADKHGTRQSADRTKSVTGNTNQVNKGNTMSRYVSLFRFTEQGARNIKKSTARAEAFKQATRKAGVTVEALYWTVGSYDGLLIIKAATESKALHGLTELATAGNVRSETMQAFDAKEFAAIVGK